MVLDFGCGAGAPPEVPAATASDLESGAGFSIAGSTSLGG